MANLGLKMAKMANFDISITAEPIGSISCSILPNTLLFYLNFIQTIPLRPTETAKIKNISKQKYHFSIHVSYKSSDQRKRLKLTILWFTASIDLSIKLLLFLKVCLFFSLIDIDMYMRLK